MAFHNMASVSWRKPYWTFPIRQEVEVLSSVEALVLSVQTRMGRGALEINSLG
jgi:hypothetical protein